MEKVKMIQVVVDMRDMALDEEGHPNLFKILEPARVSEDTEHGYLSATYELDNFEDLTMLMSNLNYLGAVLQYHEENIYSIEFPKARHLDSVDNIDYVLPRLTENGRKVLFRALTHDLIRINDFGTITVKYGNKKPFYAAVPLVNNANTVEFLESSDPDIYIKE